VKKRTKLSSGNLTQAFIASLNSFCTSSRFERL